MIYVGVRECGRGLRAEREFEFVGDDVAGSVRTALLALYPDARLDAVDIADAGVYRRTIARELLLTRSVIIKVRVQGELWT
jgi:hypothetical protein